MTLPRRLTHADVLLTPSEREEQVRIEQGMSAHWLRDEAWQKQRKRERRRTVLFWLLWVALAVGVSWLVVHWGMR